MIGISVYKSLVYRKVILQSDLLDRPMNILPLPRLCLSDFFKTFNLTVLTTALNVAIANVFTS